MRHIDGRIWDLLTSALIIKPRAPRSGCGNEGEMWKMPVPNQSRVWLGIPARYEKLWRRVIGFIAHREERLIIDPKLKYVGPGIVAHHIEIEFAAGNLTHI